MPAFELAALEVLLEVVCSDLAARTARLVVTVREALDALRAKVRHGVVAGSRQLEEVREQKNVLNEMLLQVPRGRRRALHHHHPSTTTSTTTTTTSSTTTSSTTTPPPPPPCSARSAGVERTISALLEEEGIWRSCVSPNSARAAARRRLRRRHRRRRRRRR